MEIVQMGPYLFTYFYLKIISRHAKATAYKKRLLTSVIAFIPKWICLSWKRKKSPKLWDDPVPWLKMVVLSLQWLLKLFTIALFTGPDYTCFTTVLDSFLKGDKNCDTCRVPCRYVYFNLIRIKTLLIRICGLFQFKFPTYKSVFSREIEYQFSQTIAIWPSDSYWVMLVYMTVDHNRVYLHPSFPSGH